METLVGIGLTESTFCWFTFHNGKIGSMSELTGYAIPNVRKTTMS